MVVQDNLRTDLVSSPLKNDKKHRLKQRFDVQRKLGQGTYGKVQLAVNRETGQEVAVKTIKKNKIENEQDLIRIRREIQIMSSIQHPHITHIYEVFENKDKIVLVMQFASGGELYDYLSEKKVLSDLEARRIFRQIAAAVYYCHKNKICHRDLKLENILLDEKGNAKIADFGLSNVFDQKNLLNTYCGSPLYASPEIVKGVPYYGPEVDCWSMGVLLYTLVYGAMPFDGSNFRKLVTQISEGDYFEPKKKSNASELVRKLLTVNPSKRATIVDICVDYWVNLGYEHCLLQVAEDMANLTPVRLDLLLALAPDTSIPQEEAEKDEQDVEKDPVDEDEEEDDEYNDDTAANSFAFMKGSHASQLSISSPNLQKVANEYKDSDEDEFLPADIAVALQAECGKRLAEGSFGSSLPRVSSLAHQSKKPKKSESTSSKDRLNKDTAEKVDVDEKSQKREDNSMPSKNLKAAEKNSSTKLPDIVSSSKPQNSEVSEYEKVPQESFRVPKNTTDEKPKVENEKKELPRKDSISGSKSTESPFITQRKESLTTQEEKVDAKKFVRPPGKITIPKTFDSPQSTPSPKPVNSKTLTKNSNVSESNECLKKESLPVSSEVAQKEITPNLPSKTSAEDINKNVIESESTKETKVTMITEDKKNAAKSILKKGIAKAKLAERKMSKQGSTESDVASSCSTPVSTGGTPETMPSFFKAPKPYTKEENTSVTSKAEIKLSSTQNSNTTLKNDSICKSNAPLWEAGSHLNDNRQLEERNLNWSTVSSTIDSEMSNWREQMEESLRRLSPEDERCSNPSYALSKVDDDKPLVPIARSYKKFTFTKDGACITETKKIYTTPGADGSWTKVEKKTKITTRPGNVEEFEKFRDMHLRTDSSPSLVRSDSQSSSGSNDVYDDIFDSWTGDTMMCNVRKMNNMFQKFSRDPFLRRERRRNPFRLFRRTESERNDRERANGRSIDRGTSENEEDCDVHFDDSNAAVYGSQGLWQLLRTANRGFPGRVSFQHEPVIHNRSASQDRSDTKFETNWRRCGSRASSGYNTGTRSQSRDRTESPREKVLRFVFESPREGVSRETSVRESPGRHEKWSVKRNLSRHNPRRDSGVGSDGYESEYSIRPSPSDEMSRTGRVSSISSVASDKQGMIRNFMKSWSKEIMSPPISPTSLESAKEHLESLPESKKHRVEQWLDMNTGSMPFDRYSDGQSKLSSRKAGTSHCNSSYATMRPREYLQYNRASSDKLSDCTDFFPSFEDSHRRRSQNLNKNESLSEMGKIHFRNTAYSPVSGESLRDMHAARITENFGPAVHQINFTFSDGRTGSSHAPQTTRYVKQFSSSNDGCITVESPPGGNFRVEQISGKSSAQPVVQMRVSINRSNPVASPPIHPASKGLWEQQDSLVPPRQDISVSVGREPSPVPGIRQFSTEVQHCVGNVESSPKMSVQCEVAKSAKTQTGKNSPYKHQLPAESSIWDMANCMKNSPELTNINKHDSNECSYSNDLSNRPKNLSPHYQNQAEPAKCQSASTNGANTPDSLEDLNVVERSIESNKGPTNECFKTASVESLSDVVGLHVEVKPLGILWNSQVSQNGMTSPEIETNRSSTFVKTLHSSTSSIRSDASDLQKRCIENTTSEIGSIWNQKKACHPFDLLKNLLSDDGLDSFSSSKCVMTSSSSNENSFPDLAFNNENMFGQNSVVGKQMSVIENIELERLTRDSRFHKVMPSLMDDLQSPKEVLRQAMKICDSFEPC